MAMKEQHPIYKVTSFNIIEPYSLIVRFDDNSEQRIDLSELLVGELYGPLKDSSFFNKVSLDPEIKTLVWPNGADFDPEILHDWSKYKDLFIRKASRWSTS